VPYPVAAAQAQRQDGFQGLIHGARRVRVPAQGGDPCIAGKPDTHTAMFRQTAEQAPQDFQSVTKSRGAVWHPGFSIVGLIGRSA
ncbi:MAG: hypothetical protein Q7J57_05645, partial [Gemmobacter sp.]|nr:hypothetical protein [Gemmobacter sp.]